jgi:hypothetical protein
MGATHSVISLAHDGGLATAEVTALGGEAPADGEKWLTGARRSPRGRAGLVTQLIDGRRA